MTRCHLNQGVVKAVLAVDIILWKHVNILIYNGIQVHFMKSFCLPCETIVLFIE